MKIDTKSKAIELLVDGEEAFSRIIERIRSSSKTIYINMFIWRDDKIGNIIAKELIDAANRGVNISIVKDKLGEVFEKAEENKQSFFHKKFHFGLLVKALAVDMAYPMKEKAKGYKQRYNSLVGRLIKHSNIDIRYETIRGDHSKYYIFDEEIIIMGGMNIEDKTIYTDVEGKKYSDYMVEIVGGNLVEKFIQRLYYNKNFNEKSHVDFIFNANINDETIYEAKEKIIQILSSAKESIDIIMAYLGDKDITDKIIESANKGVNINILLPGKSNVQHDLNMKVLKYIMKKTNNKVNAYLSNNMIHAKFIKVDDKVVTLGSTNFNKQATKELLELNVLIKDYDDEFSEVLNGSIQNNISNSKRINDGSKIKFNVIKAMLEEII